VSRFSVNADGTAAHQLGVVMVEFVAAWPR
jgi:hypothetical protein